VGGTLVTTESGSKYFLEDASSAADAKKRQAEEKRQAAAAAAEETKAAKAAARELAAEQKKAAAEDKKREAEEKRAAQAEARELVAEAKRAAAEAKKRGASAQQTVGQAKRGASISLFGIGQPAETKAPTKVAPQRAAKKAQIVSKAPRGVPAISNWKQNRDGSISGRVFGSDAFDEGESVTTSAITSDAVDGAVVQTLSGSKYYLQPKAAAKPKGGAGLGNFLPSGTISVSSGFSEFTAGSPKSNKKAPKGVPSLSNWKKNRDDSITGLISGSPNFNEGERITTSPIESGKLENGQVVKTGSGSKYFLS